MNKITSPHDKFFKQVFTRGDTAKEFLLNYLPPAVVRLIDWDSLEYTNEGLRVRPTHLTKRHEILW